MIRNFLVIVLSLTFFGSMAQYDESEDLKANHPFALNELIGKVELINAVNPVDPSIIGAVEYQFKPLVSFSQELGVVMDVRGFNNNTDVFGLKIREEIRKYFPSGFYNDGLLYMSFNVNYRYLETREALTVGYGCTGDWESSCDYLRGTNNLIRTNRFGAGAKLGISKTFASNIIVETDLGINVQNFSFTREDLDDVTLFFDNNIFNNESQGWQLVPLVSAKVGYVFRKYRKP